MRLIWILLEKLGLAVKQIDFTTEGNEFKDERYHYELNRKISSKSYYWMKLK